MSKYYIPAEGHKCNNLKVEVYYSLGGFNYFTYKNDPRGYFLSVTPVDRADRGGYVSESVAIGEGVKMLLKEVARKSAKAEAIAEEIAKSKVQELVDWCCQQYDMTVKEA